MQSSHLFTIQVKKPKNIVLCDENYHSWQGLKSKIFSVSVAWIEQRN